MRNITKRFFITHVYLPRQDFFGNFNLMTNKNKISYFNELPPNLCSNSNFEIFKSFENQTFKNN